MDHRGTTTVTRLQLTQRIVALLPDSERISVDEAMMTWWKNIRENGGYRLTNDGYAVLAGVLEFEHWCVEAPPNHRLMIELDKKLVNPYYIDGKKKQLVLFGSREAMMANLHGDVRRWLELLERRSI
jgi:hypothetical protein